MFNEYLTTKKEKQAKQTAKGRIQVEKNVRKVMKKSLIPAYQKIIDYNPYDIKLVGSPIYLVVFIYYLFVSLFVLFLCVTAFEKKK